MPRDRVAYNRAWAAAHREEKAARQRAWSAAHPDYERAYRAAHPRTGGWPAAYNPAYNRAYRKEHRDHIRAYNRAWAAAHPEVGIQGERVPVHVLPPELQRLALLIREARLTLRAKKEVPA